MIIDRNVVTLILNAIAYKPCKIPNQMFWRDNNINKTTTKADSKTRKLSFDLCAVVFKLLCTKMYKIRRGGGEMQK